MKLAVKPRIHERKSDATRLRREGQVPAVIYHKDKGEAISISQAEFASGIRQIVSGRLATTICHLDDGKGKAARRAIIKDIQYHPISYEVLHLDFEELQDDRPVKVKIPVALVGEMDSVGIKLGGMVRLVIRGIRVECLPENLPEFFEVDVTKMNIGDTVKIEDIKIPNNVRPLMKMNSVAVSMVKK